MTRWVVDAPGRVRRTTGRMLAGLGVLIAGLCALMWVDVLWGNVIPVLQALTPAWVVLAGVLAVLLLCVRTRASLLAVVPLILSASFAGVTLTALPQVPRATLGASGHEHLRVFSLNAEFGEADAGEIRAAVSRIRPDVVVFPEMTAAKLALLDQEGLRRQLPYRSAGMIDDGARGTVILSRFRVTTLDADTDLGPYDLQTPTVRVAAPGADVVVRGVHTYPPLSDGVQQWRPQLDAEGAWQRAQTDEHVIMAGDFNASSAHPSFRRLSTDMVDALPAVVTSWPPTWPHGSALPPFAQIDHILTRGFVPVDAGTVTIAGTDHAAVWADLRY